MKGLRQAMSRIRGASAETAGSVSSSSRRSGPSSSMDSIPDVPASSADQLREECEFMLSKEAWFSEGLSFFIFGASGDLARRMTYPSLFALYCAKTYDPKQTIICGYARTKKTDEEFREHIKPYLMKTGSKELKDWSKDQLQKSVDEFLQICTYRTGNYDSPADLEKAIAEVDRTHKSRGTRKENRVFYFAIPPDAYVSTAKSVKQVGLSSSGGFNRVIIEKPFGHDTESAKKLGKEIGELFNENDVYRIDHFLGKEMVQNLIILRFANAFLEPLWNKNYVKSVLISFKEEIGTEGRAGYFEKAGVIRDMMQNHLIQVLSIVAMERPNKLSGEGYADSIRDEKLKVLKAFKPIELKDVVLGQYEANPEKDKPGYHDDDSVPKDSLTPTFCTAVIHINNPRWEGVPFILKTGKSLDEKKSVIRIQFKAPSGAEDMYEDEQVPLNELVIRLAPKEAVYLKTYVKKPGFGTAPIQAELDLTYEDRYPVVALESAYTRLILDVLRGKQATFVRNDELMAAWEVFTPLLHEIEEKKIKPIAYKAGTRGPAEADVLIEKNGYVKNLAYQRQWEAAHEKHEREEKKNCESSS